MEKNNIWKQIYDLAAEIYKLSPWDHLLESDLFGVVIPDSGRQYFISIMGAEGNLMAIAAYEGPLALTQFWLVDNSETADAGEILSIPHMIMTFESEDEIDPEQMKRFRLLNSDPVFSDKFPEVRRIIPGRYPHEPVETYLNDLLVILSQSLHVIQRAVKDPDLILPPDSDENTYLIRAQGSDQEWSEQYQFVKTQSLPVNLTWTDEDIDEVISLPSTQTVLQAHFQLLPFQVVEKDKPVHYPYCVLLVNKKSGRIENSEMLIADPDYYSMIGKLPSLYLEFIKSLAFRPRAIEVKSGVLEVLLTEPLQLCGIRLVSFKHLPAMNEAIEGIIEYMGKERR